MICCNPLSPWLPMIVNAAFPCWVYGNARNCKLLPPPLLPSSPSLSLLQLAVAAAAMWCHWSPGHDHVLSFLPSWCHPWPCSRSWNNCYPLSSLGKNTGMASGQLLWTCLFIHKSQTDGLVCNAVLWCVAIQLGSASGNKCYTLWVPLSTVWCTFCCPDVFKNGWHVCLAHFKTRVLIMMCAVLSSYWWWHMDSCNANGIWFNGKVLAASFLVEVLWL